MGLVVRVPRRLRRELRFRFSDDVGRIVIGRDRERCHILFTARVRSVGREHCALERVLGRYRLVLNGDDPVFVDGEVAYDGDELPSACELRLGARGPRLHLQRTVRPGLPPVERIIGARGLSARPRRLLSAIRLHRAALVGVVAILFPALALLTVTGVLDLRSSEARSDADLYAALERAMPSVYRVISRAPDGGEWPVGTAWVIDDRRLATNAHVAEIVQRLPRGASLHVRSHGPDPRTYRVTATLAHPGFEAFDALWSGYQPMVGSESDWRFLVQSAGSGCDVALLEVEPGSVLGRPLSLARDETLCALAAGEAVGYVGYPAESLALTGSPVARPMPHRHTGRITSVTDFFGAPAAPERNHLVQHDCPGTGGSSGSPLLNDCGEVVGLISAGNFAYTPFGRSPSGAGVNYAQRVDLLRELLDGRAQSLQEARERRWCDRIVDLYASGWRQRCSEAVEALLDRRSRALEQATHEAECLVWSSTATERVQVDVASDAAGAAVAVPVDVAGRYVLAVVPTLWRELEIVARFQRHGDATGRGLVDEHVRGRELVSIFDCEADRAGTIHVAVTSEDHPADVVLTLYRAAPTPLTPDVLRERSVNEWLSGLRRATGITHEAVLDYEVVVSLGAGDGNLTHYAGGIEPEVDGSYLVLAVAREAAPFRMHLKHASRVRGPPLVPVPSRVGVRHHRATFWVAKHQIGKTRTVTLLPSRSATGPVTVELRVYWAWHR